GQTVRNIASTLTKFFADVKAEHRAPLTVNPMRDDEVRDVLPSAESPDPEDIAVYSRETIEGLLEHLADRDPYLFGVVLFEVTSGERDGEAHGLQFGDIREEGGIVYAIVLRQAMVPRDALPVKLGPPKSRWSRRKIALHPTFIRWLSHWKAEGWSKYVGR